MGSAHDFCTQSLLASFFFFGIIFWGLLFCFAFVISQAAVSHPPCPAAAAAPLLWLHPSAPTPHGCGCVAGTLGVTAWYWCPSSTFSWWDTRAVTPRRPRFLPPPPPNPQLGAERGRAKPGWGLSLSSAEWKIPGGEQGQCSAPGQGAELQGHSRDHGT